MQWVYKICGETRTFHPLWRRGIIQHSVSWRWIGRGVSVHKFQVIFARAESSGSSQDWMGSPVAFFLFIFPTRLHDVQLLMSHLQQQFLRSQHDRWFNFFMRNKTSHLLRNIKTDKSFPLPDYVQCLPLRLLTPSYLFLHKSKPWGDMKETNMN